jgi:O-methyltransferase
MNCGAWSASSRRYPARVWRGGTALVLAFAATKFGLGIEVVAADTFKGVAKAGRHDPVYSGGEHADASEDLVKRLFDRSGCSNVRVLSGVFPDETGAVVAQRSFRMCHVDVDVYESARDTFEWVWPRLARGGVVVFDDYGFVKCPGVTRFVNECKQRPDALLLYNLNGHALLVKR